MPSLMALKKRLQGDNPEVLESHLFLLCAFLKFKNKKNIEGNLKLHKKKVKMRKTSIVEVAELLELCSCP